MATDTYLDMMTRGILWAVYGEKAPDINQDTASSDAELAELVKQGKPKQQGQTGACCGEGNLALGKAATASSEETGKNNFAKNATDGDLSSRWCAAGPDAGAALTIDLGTPQTVRWIRLHWESKNNAYRYKVDSSLDGKEWKTAVDQSNNSKPDQAPSHEVNLKEARYLRTTFLGSSAGGWGSIWKWKHTKRNCPNSSKLQAAPLPRFETSKRLRVSMFTCLRHHLK